MSFNKSLVILALPIYLISGCYSEPMIQVKEVYVPIKCDIAMPKRTMPVKTSNSIDYALKLTQSEVAYRLELENALKFCIGEKE